MVVSFGTGFIWFVGIVMMLPMPTKCPFCGFRGCATLKIGRVAPFASSNLPFSGLAEGYCKDTES